MTTPIRSPLSWYQGLLLVFVYLLCLPQTLAADAPRNPGGVEVGQSSVRWFWDRVPGARDYAVTVDGQFVDFTRDPQLFSRNLWAGDHSMTVVAIMQDGSRSARSATAKIVVSANYNASSPATAFVVGGTAPASQPQQPATQQVAAPQPVFQNDDPQGGQGGNAQGGSVQTPQNPRGREVGQGTVQWEWDWVPGAANYEMTVDGVVVGTTPNTNYFSENLWAGDHSLRVRAISGGGQYSGHSSTAKIVVSGNYNPGNPAQSFIAGGPSAPSQPSVSNNQPPPPQPQTPANDNGLIDVASWSIPEAYSKPGYELVFSDEFNGGSLNPVRWNSQLRWDGEFNGERYEYRVINNEDQFYVNILSEDQGHRDTVLPVYNPFEFNGSRMAIRAIKNPLQRWQGGADFGPLFEMVSQQTFLSGAISTHDKFFQKFGYFEARLKIPSHVGTFPAFWLFHQKRHWEGTQRTEIDVMENLGHAPWYIYNTFHYYTGVNAHYGGNANHVRPYPNGQIYTGVDYSQNYHKYAVKWEPGHIAWYIDDVKVSEVWNGNADYEELYVILNLAMGGNWTNYPSNSGGLGRDPSQRFPNANDLANFGNPALEIDYVRVYRKK